MYWLSLCLTEVLIQIFQFSVSSVPDILLLAYQHSILLSLSKSAQVHVVHRHIE